MTQFGPGMTPTTPSAAPRPSRAWLWILLGSLGFLFICGIIALFALIAVASPGGRVSRGSGPGVAIIRVEGEIVAGREESGFGSSTVAGAETIVEQLQKAMENDDVKSILLRINSPGGSAAGSEEVYNQIMRVRDGGKPVVVSMGDVAASGGYYIAAAADEIYADGGTLTGSIGVITSHVDLSGLFKKIGVNFQNITTGEFKDMGSPDRPLTIREKQLLKAMLGDIYQQFVDAVAKGRKLPKAKVLQIADGRVFTGRQAQKIGLVDRIGGFQEALSSAADRGGISGKPRRIEYGPKGLFEFLFGTPADADMKALAQEMLKREAMKELSRSMLQ